MMFEGKEWNRRLNFIAFVLLLMSILYFIGLAYSKAQSIEKSRKTDYIMCYFDKINKVIINTRNIISVEFLTDKRLKVILIGNVSYDINTSRELLDYLGYE